VLKGPTSKGRKKIRKGEERGEEGRGRVCTEKQQQKSAPMTEST